MLLNVNQVLGAETTLTLRRSTQFTLKTCSNTAFPQRLPLTTRYIQGIASEIINANPEVFNGDLDPQKICVGPELTNSERAWAEADQRSLTIETGNILRTQNEAQLAYVIGHELAHIALRHTPLEGNPVPEPDHDLASSTIREKQLNLEKIINLQKGESQAEMDRLQDEDQRLLNQLEQIFARYFENDFSINWMETEADVTGAVYAMKAGFASIEIGWRQEELAVSARAAGLNPRTQNTGRGYDPHAPSPALSSVERVNQAREACHLQDPEIPLRGEQRYPMPCWQIWNLKTNLLNDSLYGSLFHSPKSRTASDMPSLAEVKQEIPRALQNQAPVRK